MLSGFLGDGIDCLLLLAKVNRQPILGQGDLFESQQHKIQAHHIDSQYIDKWIVLLQYEIFI